MQNATQKINDDEAKNLRQQQGNEKNNKYKSSLTTIAERTSIKKREFLKTLPGYNKMPQPQIIKDHPKDPDLKKNQQDL